MFSNTQSHPDLSNFDERATLPYERLSRISHGWRGAQRVPRLDPWLALAVVAITAWASSGVSTWLLERWQWR